MTQYSETPAIPGKVLEHQFLKPLKVSQSQLARDIDVPRTRIVEIIHGQRAITADTALRLATYFDTDPLYWLTLQTKYDLHCTIRDRGDEIKQRIRQLKSVA